MEPPSIVLDRDGERPLAVQLADALRAATAAGRLRAGDRLPSTRGLAGALGVSRTVTSAAYDQLLAEGWVAGRRGSGTFVIDVPGGGVPRSLQVGGESGAGGLPPGALPPGGQPPAHRPVDGMVEIPGRPAGGAGVDLRAGAPCVEAIEPAAWRRAWRAAADTPPDGAPTPAGVWAFRAAVVEHLLRHRGLPADPTAVLATAGSTSGVAELARTFPAGARVAVEEPGYQRAVAALRDAGLRVLPAPVDDAGLVVDELPGGLAAVYCTPAHQYPLGARLSAARRVALIERAHAQGFLVIEDDYDGELRYDVGPLPLLAALGPDVVAHLGTASKLLTPTLGVGWLVAPPAVRAAVLDLRARTGTRPAPAGQRVFTAFAAHGDLARHLRHLRRELSERRTLTVAAVGCAVLGDAAGAHVVVPLPGATAEHTVLAAAAVNGVELDGLARHHAGRPVRYGVVLGYAGPTRADLERALPAVAEVLAPWCGRGTLVR